MKKGLILTAGLWLAACTPKTESVCGVYQGTLPAADAPGIETTLTFGEDNQVSQRLVYIGKKDGIFTDRGAFSASGSGVPNRAVYCCSVRPYKARMFSG